MKRNKLIGMIAIVCVAAICVTLLTGCKGSLKMPEDITYDNGMFSWNAVEGADGYMVSVNDSTDEVYVKDSSVSAFDSRFKKSLVDSQVNTLNIKAVTLDKDGNVMKYSKIAKYEFDYVIPIETSWKVTLDLNYVGAPQAQTILVKNGEKLDKPADPQRLGWTFTGWYRDEKCLVAVSFTATGKSNFNVTANTTLYAKWTADKPITTTSVYYYSESWTQVTVKPYNGETALFDGEGVVMAAIASKTNWFKADIADTATSVIFTNGTDSTESAAFDKAKPYCKDGVWTASMPTEQPVVPDHSVVYIKVGDGEPQQLTENPAVAGEFMIDVTLEIGDTVVITIDGKTVSNYDSHCSFKGTATVQGVHSFYVTEERIWVEAPEAPSVASVIINGDTENAKGMKEHPSDDTTVEIQYAVTVTLKEGDTVKIMIGASECTNYESGCGFTGTAALDGEYTFYAKKYNDGREDSIWVTIPREITTTSTKVYFHNTAVGHKLTAVYLYCWNDSPSKNNKWPGVKMEALGNDWFVLEIEAGYSMIIFDNGKGGVGNQTSDLELVVVDGCAYYDFNGVTNDRPPEA